MLHLIATGNLEFSIFQKEEINKRKHHQWTSLAWEGFPVNMMLVMD